MVNVTDAALELVDQKLLSKYLFLKDYNTQGKKNRENKEREELDISESEGWKAFRDHGHTIIKDFVYIINKLKHNKNSTVKGSDMNKTDKKELGNMANLLWDTFTMKFNRAILEAAKELDSRDIPAVTPSTKAPLRNIQPHNVLPGAPARPSKQRPQKMLKADAKHIVDTICKYMKLEYNNCDNNDENTGLRKQVSDSRSSIAGKRKKINELNARIKKYQNRIIKATTEKDHKKKKSLESKKEAKEKERESLKKEVGEALEGNRKHTAKANAKARSCKSLKHMMLKIKGQKDKFNTDVQSRTVKRKDRVTKESIAHVYNVNVIKNGKRVTAEFSKIKPYYFKQALEKLRHENMYKTVSKAFWLKHVKYGNLPSLASDVEKCKKDIALAKKTYENTLRQICEGDDGCKEDEANAGLAYTKKSKLTKTAKKLTKTAKNARIVKDWGTAQSNNGVEKAVEKFKIARTEARKTLNILVKDRESQFVKGRLTHHSNYLKNCSGQLKGNTKDIRHENLKKVNQAWKTMSQEEKNKHKDKKTYYSLKTPSSLFEDIFETVKQLKEYTKYQKYFYKKVYQKTLEAEGFSERNAEFQKWLQVVKSEKRKKNEQTTQEKIDTHFETDKTQREKKLNDLFSKALDYKGVPKEGVPKEVKHQDIISKNPQEHTAESIKLSTILKYINLRDALWTHGEIRKKFEDDVSRDPVIVEGITKGHLKALNIYYKELVDICQVHSNQVFQRYLLPQKLYFMRKKKGKAVSNIKAWRALATKLRIMDDRKKYKLNDKEKDTTKFTSKSLKGRQLLESKKIYAMYPLPEVDYSWRSNDGVVGPHLLYRQVGDLMIPIEISVAAKILEDANKSGR
jgi:hypothetical protein